MQRLRTLQEKKNAQAKASRRDIAMLLEKGRIETARIKTENSECVLPYVSRTVVPTSSQSSMKTSMSNCSNFLSYIVNSS